MGKLMVPQDYDIVKAYMDNNFTIDGSKYTYDPLYDTECEIFIMPKMLRKNNNTNIVGYLSVDKAQKGSCLNDGFGFCSEENKPYIEQDGICGRGMYFIEYNYSYAVDLIKSQKRFIVGAIINPSNILDFTEMDALILIRDKEAQFKNHIAMLLEQYQSKASQLKNVNSKEYHHLQFEINRLMNSDITMQDFLIFLDLQCKKEKLPKYDAVRFIKMETNSFCGMQKYQASVLFLRNHKKVTEYFNPLKEEHREYINKKYFSSK